jgi:hypothetical protein
MRISPDPEWLRCRVVVLDGLKEAELGEVGVTRADIDGLARELSLWQRGQPLEFESTDGSLILRGDTEPERPDAFLECFVGEPANILSGCRIRVELSGMPRVISSLLDSATHPDM